MKLAHKGLAVISQQMVRQKHRFEPNAGWYDACQLEIQSQNPNQIQPIIFRSMTWEAPVRGKSAGRKKKDSTALSEGPAGTDDVDSTGAATSNAEDRTTAATASLSGMANLSNGGTRFASL